MRAGLLASLGLFLLAVPANASETLPNYTLTVWLEKGKCRVLLDGEYVPAKMLVKRMKLLPEKSAEVLVSAKEETPYRCVGGAIYSAQEAGFVRIGFVTPEAKQ